MGEVSNSSKETDKSRMDFLRGKRGGMFGKVLEGGYYMNCAKSLTMATVFIHILVFPQYAYAYIDPGAGSCVFQIIIATLVVGLFFIKLFFNKIKNFLANLFSNKKDK